MALGTTEVEVKPGKWKRNEEIATEEIDDELEVIQGVAVDQNGLVWLYGEDGGVHAPSPTQGALTEYNPPLNPPTSGSAYGRGPRPRRNRRAHSLALGAKGSATQDRLYARYEAHGSETLEGKEEPKRRLLHRPPVPHRRDQRVRRWNPTKQNT